MKNYLIISYAIVFLIHQITECFGLHHPFMDSYLDDFLFLPLFLFSVEKMICVFTGYKYTLRIQHEVFVAVYAIVLVECIFPVLSNRFIFDYYDFLAYFLGIAFFKGFSKVRALSSQV